MFRAGAAWRFPSTRRTDRESGHERRRPAAEALARRAGADRRLRAVSRRTGGRQPVACAVPGDCGRDSLFLPARDTMRARMRSALLMAAAGMFFVSIAAAQTAPQTAAAPQAIIETSLGTITVTLDPAHAPRTVIVPSEVSM